MVVVMHWIDVGGRDVGSISKFATDIFQEGIQFRTVKLQSRGEPVREMYRMIEHNTRFPVEMMGDINSQIGGCLLGRDSVAELAGRYGIDTFLAALSTRSGINRKPKRAPPSPPFPTAPIRREATLDNDGLNPDPLPCKVTVIVSGDEMTIDLSELPREVNAPMNSGRSGGGSTVARLAFRYLLLPEGDANEGTFRPLKLILPEGTIVSAQPTAPMGSYNSALPTADRSRHPSARFGDARSGRSGPLRHLLDARLCRTAPGHRRVLAMPRQRLRRLGRALRHGRSGPVPHHVPWRHAAHSRSSCTRRAIHSCSKASVCGPIPAAPVNFVAASVSSGAI